LADSGWIAVMGVAVGGGLAARSALLQRTCNADPIPRTASARKLPSATRNSSRFIPDTS
jgi:hypothetical protein